MGLLWWRKKQQDEQEEWMKKISDEQEKLNKRTPEFWKERIARYKWECEHRPDYTKLPAVDEEMERMKDPFGYALKKMNPQEREEALKRQAEYEQTFDYKFVKRSQELKRRSVEEEMANNDTPARKEDTKLWRSLPPVLGPDGIPYVRKALTLPEANRRIVDFFKQHLFGLWGYRQRPYPSTYPIDLPQALGYKWLQKRFKDFIMRGGSPWYYKDRLGRTRGPMELITMQTAWSAGIIDKNTFVWGDDMDEWAPIGMIYGLQQCITRPEVKIATFTMEMLTKFCKGVPLNALKKGHERKTLKQLQDEAIEQRDRERAVLSLCGGIWPSEREPSHAMFLWAGGAAQLSDALDKDSLHMRDKFVSLDQRKQLMKLCPGLRPRDFHTIEQIMDAITYQGEWYRERLGTFTTKPSFERDWFKDMKEEYEDTVEEVEHFFKSIEGAPDVKFPRKPGDRLIVTEKKPKAEE